VSSSYVVLASAERCLPECMDFLACASRRTQMSAPLPRPPSRDASPCQDRRCDPCPAGVCRSNALSALDMPSSARSA